jgi:hypothetical protein
MSDLNGFSTEDKAVGTSGTKSSDTPIYLATFSRPQSEAWRPNPELKTYMASLSRGQRANLRIVVVVPGTYLVHARGGAPLANPAFLEHTPYVHT